MYTAPRRRTAKLLSLQLNWKSDSGIFNSFDIIFFTKLRKIRSVTLCETANLTCFINPALYLCTTLYGKHVPFLNLWQYSDSPDSLRLEHSYICPYRLPKSTDIFSMSYPSHFFLITGKHAVAGQFFLVSFYGSSFFIWQICLHGVMSGKCVYV